MKTIELSQGLVSKVSDEDYEWLKEFNWFAQKCNGKIYAARHKMESERCPTCNQRTNKRSKIVLMHREIINAPKGMHIDHKNRDELDNQRENLRPATISQNLLNTKGRNNSSSIYKGISYTKTTKKWVVALRYEKKQYYLGQYMNEESAARIYDYWIHKIEPEFALLNFPENLLTDEDFYGINTLKKDKLEDLLIFMPIKENHNV